MGNESQAKVIFANGNGAKTTGDSLRETDTERESEAVREKLTENWPAANVR